MNTSGNNPSVHAMEWLFPKINVKMNGWAVFVETFVRKKGKDGIWYFWVINYTMRKSALHKENVTPEDVSNCMKRVVMDAYNVFFDGVIEKQVNLYDGTTLYIVDDNQND